LDSFSAGVGTPSLAAYSARRSPNSERALSLNQAMPRFLNAAASLVTQLGATELHEELRALETALGKRPPAVRFGPRCIDLDLLAYGALTLKSDSLELPHPRLHERAFVLYPLSELAPELWIAGRGRVAALKAAVAGDGLSPQ
jgi:2-amino-4-hydroxy-6-hydroxymethyldihydropteridine diphosphokinase